MPTYEFRCRTCDAVFTERRPMAEASAPATCPDGHADTVKLLSSFAAIGSAAPGAAAIPAAPCGAACGCHPN